MKLRICFLSETFYPIIHGSARQIMLLGKQLVRRGHEVQVITRKIKPGDNTTESIDGYKVIRVPPAWGTHPWGKYAMWGPTLWSCISRRKTYDILVVSDVKALGPVGVLCARMLGKSCLLRAATCGEIDGSYVYMYDPNPSRFKVALAGWVASARNFFLKRADRFLSISSAISRELEQSVLPTENLIYFGNGIDTEQYKPASTTEADQLRERLNISGQFQFLYVGRLARGKGLPTLLAAWNQVRETHKNAHLLIVGSGQGLSLAIDDQLKTFAADHGLTDSVTFVGHVENVRDYLRAADCFVFPTENEALGNSVIEAASCGLPCIASNVGGVPDVVVDDENGILVEPFDSGQIARAMTRMLSDASFRERCSRKSRDLVLQRFDVERKVDQLETICSDLPQRRKPG